ncbi:A/G-specific adenine glycosylase [Capnocytophaga canis]|uniref:A/G-specific adenine glycosylase n=1 Tax=Capnocytophaga canis TaxID=1848903 RepID=UPI00385BE9E0
MNLSNSSSKVEAFDRFFSQRLLQWYNSEKRDLPWRQTTDPYKIWLSEIILQQTRVAQGLPYYERFTNHFPSVFDLANASEEQVLKLWQGLGYYSRAKNLHHTAKTIAFDLNGNFPTTHKELLKLKGIGDYTASAIASICFSESCAVVDGNVYRVLARVFGIETPIDTTSGIIQFKKLATKLLDPKNAGVYNQAIMEFGAIHCKPQLPMCESCVFSDKCVAKNQSKVERLPVKIGKTKIRKRYFNYIVPIDNQKHTILNKRNNKDIWQGLYEFPLIETEKPYSEAEIKTEIDKIFDCITDIYLHKYEKIHKLSHQHIHTQFWIISMEYSLKNSIDKEEVKNYPVSVLTANFLKEFWFFRN